MIVNTTTVNGSAVVESPADFVEYQIGERLWLYVAPSLLIIGLAGNTPSQPEKLDATPSNFFIITPRTVTGCKKNSSDRCANGDHLKSVL